MENGKNKKIEIIPKYTEVKDSDKKEGIKVYGEKPFGEERWGKHIPPEDPEIKRKKILERIESLKEKYKSPNYMGDKKRIEDEINELENILEPIKTAKELAMRPQVCLQCC